MNTIHRRRALLAAACCAALTALTLGAAGATAAKAGTATKASGSNGSPVVPTNDGPVRGTTAGTVNEFLGIPYAAPPVGNLRVAATAAAGAVAGRPRRYPVRAELPAAAGPVRAARPLQRGLPVPQRVHAGADRQ
jgi:hypothetical protein